MSFEEASRALPQKLTYLSSEVSFEGNIFQIGRCIISKAEEDVV